MLATDFLTIKSTMQFQRRSCIGALALQKGLNTSSTTAQCWMTGKNVSLPGHSANTAKATARLLY